MSVGLSLDRIRFLEGCSAGLDQKTAIAEITVAGEAAMDARRLGSLVAGAAGLCPDPSLPAVEGWPTLFVAGRPSESGPDTLARWLVGLAVAIQRHGGDPALFGRVVASGPERLVLAIPWQRRDFARESLELALRSASEWLGDQPGESRPVAEHFSGRWDSIRAGGLPGSTLRFIVAAFGRGVPFAILPSYAQLGWGVNAGRVDRELTGRTSWIAATMATNKAKASRTLDVAGLPVAPARSVSSIEQARAAAADLGWPVVVKPLNRRGGEGVGCPVADAESLDRAFGDTAALTPRHVLVEKWLPGQEYRLLVVHGRTLLAVRRSASGARDVTAEVHPDNVVLAERAARVIGLDIAAVDLLTADIGVSWRQSATVIIEVDAQPPFDQLRSAVPGRDLEAEVLDIVFADREARIPTAVIAGAAGAARAAVLLHRIWSAAGRRAGLYTDGEVRIGAEIAASGRSVATGAEVMLNDPGVEAAVFALGAPESEPVLPCDRCDVAAVLDAGDPSGRFVADVFARSSGTIVVDADDPVCVSAGAQSTAERLILVTPDPAGLPVRQPAGSVVVGLVSRHGEPWIAVLDGRREVPLMPVAEVPDTDIRGVLVGVAVAYAQGFDAAAIRTGAGVAG